MTEPAPRSRARLLALAAVLVALVAVGWLASRSGGWRGGSTPDGRAPAAAETDLARAPVASGETGLETPAPASELEAPADAAPDLEGETMSSTWEAVDLEEVRRALPNNLYWELAAPTQDYRVQREREEARARWNVEYGKVLSGTGTEDEIRAYFTGRERVSADYVEFVTYLLDHYASELPERDVTLLELARTLHLKRLEELPRKQAEAFERKRAQDAAREAWLAEEAELGLDEPR